MLSATWMSQVDMSSIALPWHWPAISHMTKLEKARHLSSWIFLRGNISSSLLVVPLCPHWWICWWRHPTIYTSHTKCRPVLMQGYLKNRGSKMLITSLNEMQQSWRNIYRLLWVLLSHSANRRYKKDQWFGIPNLQWKKHHRWQCRNRACPWPRKQWSL